MTVELRLITGVISVITMMVVIVAIVMMMIVPSCGWSRAANCDCADNAHYCSDLL